MKACRWTETLGDPGQGLRAIPRHVARWVERGDTLDNGEDNEPLYLLGMLGQATPGLDTTERRAEVERALAGLSNRERTARLWPLLAAVVLPSPDLVPRFFEGDPDAEDRRVGEWVVRISEAIVGKHLEAEFIRCRGGAEPARLPTSSGGHAESAGAGAAAPDDRPRGGVVVPPAEHATRGNGPPPEEGSPGTPPDPDTIYTVDDVRDLLRFRRENAAHRQATSSDPGLALRSKFFAIYPLNEQLRTVVQLIPPRAARMPESAAAASPVFALLRNASQQEFGRNLDEEAVEAMVAAVAVGSGRGMADLWRLTLAEFAGLKWPTLADSGRAFATATEEAVAAAERALRQLALERVRENITTVTAAEMMDALRPLGLDDYRTRAALSLEARGVLIPIQKPMPSGNDPVSAIRRALASETTLWRIGPAVLGEPPRPPTSPARLPDSAGVTGIPTPPRADDGETPVWVPRCDGMLSCAPDFSTVRRGGEQFTFTDSQRACVQKMVEAWEKGRREFTNTELLDFAGSNSESIRSVFRPSGKRSSAWNELIVAVEGKKGRYTLRLEPAPADETA